MILAGSTLAQTYLAQGYQASNTGTNTNYPYPPASSSAWIEEQFTADATWTEEALPSNP